MDEESALINMLARDERFVVLTHDDLRDEVQERFGHETLVLGIRDAKGLEFDCVVCFNIVSASPTARRELSVDGALARGRKKSAWAHALLQVDPLRNQHSSASRHVDAEIEAELMLLYTAVTRCRSRLILCEAGPNAAAAKAVEDWLFTTGLASRFVAPSDSDYALSSDEWCAALQQILCIVYKL